MTSEKNLRVSREVGPGRLTVGKMQSGVSTPEEPFTGEIASVNVWSAKLDDSKIREMSRSKSQELGNVTDWREFRHRINGDVNILSPGSPISIGKHARNQQSLQKPLIKSNLHVRPPPIINTNIFPVKALLLVTIVNDHPL